MLSTSSSSAAAASRRLPLRSSGARSSSCSRASAASLSRRRTSGLAKRLRSRSLSKLIASANDKNFDLDSNDALYVAKFAASSFAGAALIKYGSTFLDAPTHPEGKAAAALVVLPTLLYCAFLAVWSSSSSKKAGEGR